jgi:hypothetical protein
MTLHTLLLADAMLLAQNDRAERFVNAFKQGNPDFRIQHMLPVAVIVLAVAVAYYVFRVVTIAREQATICSDRRLFQELCRLHRLDSPSIKALEHVIRQEKLVHAPSIFLRPELFDVDRISNPPTRHTLTLARLREALFG